MFAKTATVLGVGALMAAGATAQTDPGFPIQVSQQLAVAFGNNTVSPPGERIPRPETANSPTIRSPSWSDDASSRAVLLLVDLDVPRNGTRVQLLHWLATDITHAPDSSNNTSALTIPAPAPVPYLQPSPPVGDSPHSYSFVLFPQPENFSIPAQYANLSQNRIFFDVAQFVSDAGLTGALAGNYITVQNLTGSATTTYPPPRATATPSGAAGNGSSPGEFQGMASARSMTSWVVGAVALLSGVAAFAL